MAGRKESTELFELIKSLSPEEKSYFRKFSKRHADKGSQALKLFDSLIKQPVYNEKPLKISFSNFAVLKQTLFDNIIQSLIISHSKPQGKITFLKVLIEVELLKERKLFDRAIGLINKYLPIARNTGALFFEEELLRMQNYHLLAGLDARGRLKQQTEYEKQYAEFCRRKENMDKMISDNQKLFAIDDLAINEPNNYPNPDAYIDLKYMEDPGNALTAMAENARRMNLALYYSIKQDVQKYYQLTKANYTEVAKQNNRGGKYNEMYIKALRGVVYGAIICRRFNEAEKLIEKHSLLKASAQWEREEHLLTTNMMKQYWFWGNGQHEKGLKFSNDELAKINYAALSERFYTFAKSFFQMKMFFEFSLGDVRCLYLSAVSLHGVTTREEVDVIDKHSEILKILAQIAEKNFDIAAGLINNLRRSKAGKKLDAKEKQLLETLKMINELNLEPVLKQLHSKLSQKVNQINIFGQQDIADLILSLQKGNSLSKAFEAEHID